MSVSGTKLLIILLLALFLIPSLASAIDVPGWPIVPCGLDRPTSEEIAAGKVVLDDSYYQPCGRCDLFKLLKNLIDFTVGGLMPALAVLLFVWAGFLILLGGANTNLVAQGRQIFSTTFFGIIIMLSAWMITNTLIKSVGSNYDTAENWWQFTCVETVPVNPPVFKYSCNQNNQCVIDPNGTYTTTNCDNQCLTAFRIVISNVAASNITNTSAVITWTTDQPSTSQVLYGTTASYGSSTLINNSQVTSHSVIITGLNPGTTYNYQAISSTTAITGFTARSSNNTFTTTGSSVTCGQPWEQNLCQPRQMTCGTSACNPYVSAINQYAGRTAVVNGANLLKAIMVKESSCNIGAQNGQSCGLMQLQVSTANIYKSRCGITVNITCDWLKNPANAIASICIASEYIGALTQTSCGNSSRGVAAGYNGGSGACNNSVDCAGETSCAGGPVQRWECLYNDPQHSVCNTGYTETRDYVTKVLYCYNNPGF